MDLKRVWDAAKGELQLQMTKATYDTWISNTFPIAYEDGTFLIGVHNTYAKEWLENRLLTIIKRTLIGLTSSSVEVKFVVRAKPGPDEQPVPTPLLQDSSTPLETMSAPPMLVPHYTFDTFIVGSSNRLPHAAALAVTENPGESYNPLFIHGGVGLGKTHLLHAVGNLALTRRLQVLYVSSETFTNDLINSIRNQTTDDFRAKYRQVDILLVDDIQFIAGKESTQEEFFHTFNTLYSAKKQIVISSDRPPKAIPTLEERLSSRFEWGLIADIQAPDLETRIAILRFKAETHHLDVPDDVIDFIAHKFQNNIRQLEGALNRAVAHAQLTFSPLTVHLTTEALQDHLCPQPTLTLDQIIDAVAAFYAFKHHDLRGSRRTKDLALARQVAMYLSREETNSSLVQIGAALGNRDHTTIMHGHGKIEKQIEEDEQLRRDVLAIKGALYANHTL
ncbi:MAG: chromosomal replication initiator protein DnaA [Anaerolineae bacterium]|nr:chromosomal replication initiator protein DnaA [Anaerolineae bacterium]NIN97098.1 chromosomal replication initiator protein DnaA [Anaerolineae bacterium]NIQ80062.1 chromosomal replication initiator protein DnaA [Anaerolineae bacterium]